MKSVPKTVQRIIDTVRNSKTFCVVGHIRPDGDCIGSQLGLTLALRNLGKDAVCWNQDTVPQKLSFLDPEKVVSTPVAGRRFDCVIATDCASYERLGTVTEHIKDRDILINIDHHGSNTRYGDINWISPKEPSSGELIFRLLKDAKWPVTPAIANCLFTAVSTDTGSFQYPSTRPSTYHTAAELVKNGAELGRICHEVYQSYPLSRVRLLQHVYNSFRLVHDDQIAYFWLKPSDFARTGATTADSEGLIDHVRDIEPVVVACVFEELEPGVARISLRSKTEQVNVSAIAQEFGGGGHPAAAGARIKGTSLAVQRKVLASIRKALDAVKS
jgi:phosphoesterase RecJ-like protein